MAKRKKTKRKSRSSVKLALVFGSKSKPRLGKQRFSKKATLNAAAKKRFANKSMKNPIGFTKVR